MNWGTPGASTPQRAGSSVANFSDQPFLQHFHQNRQFFQNLMPALAERAFFYTHVFKLRSSSFYNLKNDWLTGSQTVSFSHIVLTRINQNNPESTRIILNHSKSFWINLNQPKSTCINLYQPLNPHLPISTLINPHQPVSTRIKQNQQKSTRVNSNQPKSTRINPNQPVSTRINLY